MTPQEMDQFLADNREHFLKATRDAVISKITDSMKWTLPDAVHTVVADFMKAEIAPEVVKILASEKGAIVEAAKRAALALSDELAKKIITTAQENLTGYRAQEVFKALLGVR